MSSTTSAHSSVWQAPWAPLARPEYRTFWRRFWAGMFDGFLFMPTLIVDYWFWRSQQPLAARLLWFVGYGYAFTAYSVLMHGHSGQTLGKRLFGIRVVDLSGRPLTMLQALRREATSLPFVTWALLVGVLEILSEGSPLGARIAASGARPALNLGSWLSLWIVWLELLITLTNSKRRALHDYIAGSVVVRVARRRPVESSGVAASALIPASVRQFECSSCGAFVNFGASSCRACDQPYTYEAGRPLATPT